jgi:hypothetical protein
MTIHAIAICLAVNTVFIPKTTVQYCIVMVHPVACVVSRAKNVIKATHKIPTVLTKVVNIVTTFI